jgi:hypothetical protein
VSADPKNTKEKKKDLAMSGKGVSLCRSIEMRRKAKEREKRNRFHTIVCRAVMAYSPTSPISNPLQEAKQRAEGGQTESRADCEDTGS